MDKDYIIKQTAENTWVIIDDESGEIIDTITKDTVINYCKNELENDKAEDISANEMIDCVWWNLQDDYKLEFVDDFCQDWEKFTTWFDYICVEYLAQELIAFYKQRLDNFE